MDITLANARDFYDELSKPSHWIDEDNEDWKHNAQKVYNYLEAEPALLANPFSHVFFRVERRGNFYSASFKIRGNSDKTFSGLSAKLSKKFNSLWASTDNDGRGYFYVTDNSKKTPFICVHSIREGECEDYDDGTPFRTVQLGKNGALPREFEGNKNRFDADLEFLRLIAANYINVAYGLNPQEDKFPETLDPRVVDAKLSLIAS